VVPTVFFEITFGARSFNLCCYIATARTFEMFKLCLKAICRLLGQPCLWCTHNGTLYRQVLRL
jgi:hypothetical protein